MSHIVHPYSYRIGVIKDWKSRWFGVKGEYQKMLKGDILVREFLERNLRGMYVSGIDIERGPKLFRIIIRTSRPGMLIGKSGEGASKLKEKLVRFGRKNTVVGIAHMKIDIEEVRSPESNAAIVAHMITEGLEKRFPFRRVMKQTADKVMANRDVKGVRMYLGGRLGGAEMARTEELKKGCIPLQTLRADIDFARARAHMTYGDIGIKVWIYKGEVFADKNPRK
ncbi:MAG: 30S ribosomal protein S3 [Candidatus Taylorbacteria bacterium RIFCSPHIGHO2_02_49_25]|uniref:Small ribosomal subunit protein uS3 n=1 Tax=Candidatus Taylorbacteria bacterium RIFCSPHIGHO2_02_49_25 TaxID=1802305 RepID=A0A1G2MC89_9BACT|nr:MAG: 30S ribosomal protein S3 [Parcubacteria group bacterium GW2011_GWF2_50_9]OHA21433.1 MAG: 30S ribosomal protein S3 [Candidatus Taylorbacteria bacterium RIFCSPHIGHO2_02_49_25]OHA21590.1 MAG: 30S ribosomal protein S3 [Candidatus Taylorbacteria bacterium RIFCSPHIGHO2_01_FULL_49_60]OHA36807.1 MAG: 30S ribosomal protein S3 [Candidatus Taylorbacteria bacterium RIFCSPLOWO2_01_FULL_50_130]OHA36917.1 MAG: 30S ribosomal protein S3 [Candidatus Taylorbacteria bacterium RIFCSPLOWO2_02_50_13]OHA42452